MWFLIEIVFSRLSRQQNKNEWQNIKCANEFWVIVFIKRWIQYLFIQRRFCFHFQMFLERKNKRFDKWISRVNGIAFFLWLISLCLRGTRTSFEECAVLFVEIFSNNFHLSFMYHNFESIRPGHQASSNDERRQPDAENWHTLS